MKKLMPLFLVALLAASFSSCASRYGRPVKKKRGCGCPAWSHQETRQTPAEACPYPEASAVNP